MKVRLFFTILSFLLAFSVVVDAQQNGRRRKKIPPILKGLSVSGRIGPNIYWGDIVDDGKTRLSLEGSASKEMRPWLAVRASLGGGFFAGKQDGGLSFKTPYVELAGGADFFILNQKGWYRDRMVDPYVGIGTGLFMYSAKKTYTPPDEYHRLKYEEELELGKSDPDYKDWRNVNTGFKPCLNLYGLLGVKVKVDKRHWSVHAEVKGNYVPTDLLDGHDGYRRAYTESEIEALKEEGFDENSPKVQLGKWISGKNDFFYTIMVGCSYKFADMGWKASSEYNRRKYQQNKKSYTKNAKRKRRR